MRKDRLSDNNKTSMTPESVLVQRILGTMPPSSPEEEAEAAFNSIVRLIDEGQVETPVCLDLPAVWVSSVASSGKVLRGQNK